MKCFNVWISMISSLGMNDMSASLGHSMNVKTRYSILDAKVGDIVSGFLVCLLVFGLIKPDSLSYIGFAWLDNMLMLVDVVALFWLLLIIVRRRITISSIMVSVLCIWLCLAISTALGSRDFLEFVKIAGPASAACLLTEYMMQRAPRRFLRVCSLTMATMFTINFITIVLTYPTGLYNPPLIEGDCYFMGYDNGMIYNLIPMCAYSLLYSLMNAGKLLSLLSVYCISLAIVSVLYVQSVTGILAMAAFVLLLGLLSRRRHSILLNPIFLISIFLLLTTLLVVFHIHFFFADIISQVFGKDATLSGRTYLWDYAIQHIRDNPVFGTGATTRSVLGINGHVYAHPHCLILDLLYKGGIPMFAAFVAMLILFIKGSMKGATSVARGVIVISAFSLLIVEVASSGQFKPFFWAIFVLASYEGVIAPSSVKDQAALCAPRMERGYNER